MLSIAYCTQCFAGSIRSKLAAATVLYLCPQEVDIAIGSITITGPRQTVCDFSVTYYETGLGFLAHIPRELSKWAALLRPYQLSVWIPICVSLIFAGPIIWWIAKKNMRQRTNRKSMNLESSYELTLKIFLQQGKHFCLKLSNFPEFFNTVFNA